MIITPRTREILLLLMDNLNSHISVSDIAGHLNVTNRTIYRQLEEVYEIVEKYEMEVINVTGQGMKLSGSEEQLNDLKTLFESNDQEYELTTDDRINLIIFYLIHEKDYVKARYFSEVLNVSIQSVRNDFQQIKRELEFYDLDLITKKGDGFLINGSETKKRILLSNIFRDNISFIELIRWIEQNLVSSMYFKLLNDFGYYPIIKKSFKLLETMFLEHKIQVSDPMFQDYVFLVSIMIKRLEWNTANNYYLDNIVKRKDTAPEIYAELKELIEQDFEISLNENEQDYLEWLISINNNFQSSELSEENQEIDLVNKVHDFIVFVETTMGCRLRTDAHLQKALFEHLDRALARTRSGITIRNPMLKEIKKSYEKLYSTIKIAAEYVFKEDKFPEDEIGFLVLHFAVALDKVLDKSITALVVCSSGMGSSKMLANRLIREIPEVEIKKIVSFLKLTQENLEEYDVIFSTVSLPLDTQDYVMVSPLLNKKELAEVKKLLETIRFSKLHRKELLLPKKPLNLAELPRELEELSLTAKYGSEVLKNFHTVKIDPQSNSLPILRVLGNYMVEKGYTTSPELLMDYAEQAKLESYFGIPNTRLGYIHCQTNKVDQPLFIAFDLEKNIVFSSMEKELMEVTSVILVVSPKKDEDIVADLLSMITMLIIETPESIQLFEQCEEDKLRSLLGERIKDYVVEKIL
ncbi:transcriptional regulator MtlR [Enterococcus avium]|nr:transcriptional regulator MtlR [Enterococcus avium]